MSNTGERIKGLAEEAKGAVKKGVGDAVNNPQMEAEGAAEKAAGHAAPHGRRGRRAPQGCR